MGSVRVSGGRISRSAVFTIPVQGGGHGGPPSIPVFTHSGRWGEPFDRFDAFDWFDSLRSLTTGRYARSWPALPASRFTQKARKTAFDSIIFMIKER